MDKSKILTIIVGVISVIGLFFFIRVIAAGDDSEAVDSAVNIFVYFATYLLIITAIIAVVLSLLNLIKHPQALKKTLMGLAVLGVLLVIAYFMASGDAVTNAAGDVIKHGEAGSVSKWISTLINFTAILGVIGLIAIGQGFVKNLIR
jgi:magnesium-transporting ATPase (P-type)